MKFTFNKEERLCRKKQMNDLFARGESLYFSSFKIVWLPVNAFPSHPAKVLITVSKKYFKRATDRNRLKRLMREAYRRNKYILYDYLRKNNKSCIFMISYVGKEVADYHDIEKKIIHVLQGLTEAYEKSAI